MKVLVEDFRINRCIELPKCDDIKPINIGHALSVKYLDKNGNLKKIEGVIRAIKHEFESTGSQTVHIQIESGINAYEQ